MIDDKLTLTIATEQPTVDPGSVTIFAAGDDGEPPAYPLVLLGDGTVRPLFPAPPPPSSFTLRTPGYDAPHSHRPLVNGEHAAAFLGRATGSMAEVLWKMGIPAATGWTEVAIAVRASPALGNVAMRYVGALDLTAEMATTAPGVPCRTTVPISGIEPGAELFVIFATWSPAGMGSPVLVGSTWTDALDSGLVGTLDGDAGAARPSQMMALGQAVQTFSVRPWTRPVSAVAHIQ